MTDKIIDVFKRRMRKNMNSDDLMNDLKVDQNSLVSSLNALKNKGLVTYSATPQGKPVNVFFRGKIGDE